MMALRVSSTEPAIGELITNTAFLYSAGALSKMENSLKAALLALHGAWGISDAVLLGLLATHLLNAI